MRGRLVVVDGPNVGAVYFLRDGNTVIGRAQDCDIYLNHSQVSKQHCAISLAGDKVEITDQGSSNGTFVNGILAKRQKLKSNDKISIGPFIFEFLLASESAATNANAAAGNPEFDFAAGSTADAAAQSAMLNDSVDIKKSAKEKSLLKKIFYRFDEVVPPVFHDMNTRKEWHVVAAILLIVYILAYLGMSIHPFIEASNEAVIRQAEERAIYIARQVAELNQEALARENYAKLYVGFAEKDKDVSAVLITDLQGKVLAPGARLHENITNPIVNRHLNAIKSGNQKAWTLVKRRNQEATLAVITVPIFVASATSGLNVPKALVAVMFRLTGTAMNTSLISVVFLEALLISLILGAVFLYILTRITYMPLEKLNDDIDEVLKGNEHTVPKRVKFGPMDSLVDSVNSALARLPQMDQDDQEEIQATDNEQQIIDALMTSMQYLVSGSAKAQILLDAQGTVLAISPMFEDLSGIHGDVAVGQSIYDVSRDEAFAAMMQDMIDKAPENGIEGLYEDYEFGAGLYKMHGLAIFSLPEKVESVLVTAELDSEE